MGSFILGILVIAAVLNLEYTSAEPAYDTPWFLGHEYWNTRCEMNYKDDWLGYWNDQPSQRRTEYMRERVDTRSSCPATCDSCLNEELQCSTLAGTQLYV